MLFGHSLCLGEELSNLVIANRTKIAVVGAYGRKILWRGKTYHLIHAPLQETARIGRSYGHGHHDLAGDHEGEWGDRGFHRVPSGETVVNENGDFAGHLRERSITPKKSFLADHLFVFLRDDLLQIIRFNLKSCDRFFGNKFNPAGCNRTDGHFGIIWKPDFSDDKSVEGRFQRLRHFSPPGDAAPGKGDNHDILPPPVGD